MSDMLGNAGRPTRPRYVPDEPTCGNCGEILDDPDQPCLVCGAVTERDPQPLSMPAECLRTFRSFRGGECPPLCPGRQRDGSCLLDTVVRANEQQVAWVFEVDRDGYWVYVGPELR